jgi:hypothetical protein
MYAITLKQPWAWAVAYAGKNVENRTWAPKASIIGTRIAIHAGMGFDRDGMIYLHESYHPPPEGDLVRGAVIATAMLERVVETSDSPWFFGPLGWVKKASTRSNVRVASSITTTLSLPTE